VIRKFVLDNTKLARRLGWNPRPLKRGDPKGTLAPIRDATAEAIQSAQERRILGK
jgi:hypothetical protein